MIFNQSHKSHTQITYETNQRDGTEAWCQIDNEMKIAMIGARGQWSEYEARNHNNKKPNHPINGILKTIMINELYCGLIDK